MSTPFSSSTYAGPSADEPRGQKRPLSVSDIPLSTSSRPLASHHRPRSIVSRGSQTPESENQPRSTNEKPHTHTQIDTKNSYDPTIHSHILLRPPNSGNGTESRNIVGDGFLHRIDYMTPSSTQQDHHISLPPIKSQPFRPPPPPPSSMPTSTASAGAMSTLATAAGSRGKISLPGRREEALRSEKPYHVDPGGAGVMSPLASAASVSASRQGPHQSPSHYQNHISNDTNTTLQPPPATTSGPHPQTQAQTNASPSSPNTNTTSSSSSSSPHIPSQTTQTQPQPQTQPDLPTLESNLLRLRHYADELLSLSLHESHSLLQREIKNLEETIMQMKRERSEKLLRGLESEFPGLVGVREGIRKEGERLGYF